MNELYESCPTLQDYRIYISGVKSYDRKISGELTDTNVWGKRGEKIFGKAAVLFFFLLI